MEEAGQVLGPSGQIVDASGKIVPAATGACWAMIRERWPQYVFGFYPSELYWRPILAFALLVASLGPVLYNGKRLACTIFASIGALIGFTATLSLGFGAPVLLLSGLGGIALVLLAWFSPRRLIWCSALYPALAFLLLWGGSIWQPALAAVGILAVLSVIRFAAPRLGSATSILLVVVIAYAWFASLQPALVLELEETLPLGLLPVKSEQFGGFLLSFTIGIASIGASLPLGVLLALGRQSDMVVVRTLSIGLIEFVRGVPLIAMLFVASLLLQYFLPPQTSFDLMLRVIILVTIFSAAYIAEVVRGSFAAIPRGQYEAAEALGLEYWQGQRLVILPQALKIAIPGIVSTFIGVFKDTTLVAIVGLADPLQGVTKMVRADVHWKGIYWEPYVFVGLIFFCCCYGMSQYARHLERKMSRTER